MRIGGKDFETPAEFFSRGGRITYVPPSSERKAKQTKKRWGKSVRRAPRPSIKTLQKEAAASGLFMEAEKPFSNYSELEETPE